MNILLPLCPTPYHHQISSTKNVKVILRALQIKVGRLTLASPTHSTLTGVCFGIGSLFCEGCQFNNLSSK